MNRPRRTEVVIEPFYTPDWVQSQEDFEKALSVHVAEQIDRGVSKESIGKYLVENGLIDPENVDSYYQYVLDVVKERHPEILKHIVGELVFWTLAFVGSVGFVVFMFSDAGILSDILSGSNAILRVGYVFLAFLILGAIAIIAIVVTSIVSVATGLRKLVRHIRLGRRLDNG